MMATPHECAEKLLEALDQLEDVNYLKFRIGSSEHWILSRDKPPEDFVGGGMIAFPVQSEGEIAPGWWLWTY